MTIGTQCSKRRTLLWNRAKIILVKKMNTRWKRNLSLKQSILRSPKLHKNWLNSWTKSRARSTFRVSSFKYNLGIERDDLENDMNEFFNEFVAEVTKIEEFYVKKVKHYADEFYMLRGAFRKYNYRDYKSKRSIFNNGLKTSPILTLITTSANRVSALQPINES